MSTIEYCIRNIGLITKLTLEHIEITLMAVSISTVIGVAIGIYITRHQRAAAAVIAVALRRPISHPWPW